MLAFILDNSLGFDSALQQRNVGYLSYLKPGMTVF